MSPSTTIERDKPSARQPRDTRTSIMESALGVDAPPPSFFAREGVDPLTRAFDRKLAVHAGFDGVKVPEAEREKLFESLLELPRSGKSTVYVHVPFCETHCLYCGFYNRSFKAGESARYVDALLRELAFWRGRPAQEVGPVHALYLGGGTPTALNAPDLRRLLDGLRSFLPLANDCEITVEGRIHNFTPEKMEACLEAGANRFSLGVQTFHTDLRRSMGRLASREQVLDSLRRLRGYDQAAVVVDLIYGFPNQSMDMWLADIRDVLELGLDGVDFYQLNVFGGTPLAKAIERGSLPPAADIPRQAEFFARAVAEMTRARWRRLSISHWGRGSRERNLYNTMVKGPAHCLPFGPGAGGSLHRHFHFIESDYEAWHEAVAEGRKPVRMLMRPKPLANLAKGIAGEMEFGRLDLEAVGKGSGYPTSEILDPLVEQWDRAGLVERDGSWLTLTLAGQFWHVNLAKLMIEYLQQRIERKEEA